MWALVLSSSNTSVQRINRKEKLERRLCVRKTLRKKTTKSEYHLLVKHLAICDHEMFSVQFRMNSAQFEVFLSYVAPLIIKASVMFNVPSPFVTG